jgi:hypothetical protein
VQSGGYLHLSADLGSVTERDVVSMRLLRDANRDGWARYPSDCLTGAWAEAATWQLFVRLFGIFSSWPAVDADGRTSAGLVNGSSMCVEKHDRQFRALDVGVVTEAGERDCGGAQPG